MLKLSGDFGTPAPIDAELHPELPATKRLRERGDGVSRSRELGPLFGGYRIIERLGTRVFLVEQHDRYGALRLLPDADPARVANCFNTACMAGTMGHPGIARVIDVGHGPGPFVVTELLEGETLERRLARGPLPLALALDIARQISDVLAAAHERGILHGALEPRAIFLTHGKVKLLGFGAASLRGDAMTGIDRGELPTYTAPEQCRIASAFDARSDLYALGCVLHEMIAGRPPFASESVDQLVTSHLMASPPPLAAPTPIRKLVDSLLAKHPADRPHSATYVTAVLDGLLAIGKARSPRPWHRLGALAIAAVAAFAMISTTYAAEQELSRKLHDVFHAADLPSLPL